jgi:folate-dependent phosphoribosylglycinamide formyltransferase PurN
MALELLMIFQPASVMDSGAQGKRGLWRETHTCHPGFQRVRDARVSAVRCHVVVCDRRLKALRVQSQGRRDISHWLWGLLVLEMWLHAWAQGGALAGDIMPGRFFEWAKPRVTPSRSVLICHHDEPLNRFGLARWLASFTDLAAIIVVREPPARLWRRVRREIRRVGILRFLDVLAFRLYYRLALAQADNAWIQATLKDLLARYEDIPASCRILETASPNSTEAMKLLEEVQPDLVLARCKNILREQVFKAAAHGTFVMHPGVCPEYRNAHGCFWALVQRDLSNVGMTLLQVDAGVDTGPVYGYYTCSFDERRESHIVIQNRVVFDNLDALRAKFEEILRGAAQTIDTTGRQSQAWGQPWLTRYVSWKLAARRRSK